MALRMSDDSTDCPPSRSCARRRCGRAHPKRGRALFGTAIPRSRPPARMLSGGAAPQDLAARAATEYGQTMALPVESVAAQLSVDPGGTSG